MDHIVLTGGSGLLGSRLQTLLKNEYHFSDISLASGVDILAPQQLTEFFKQASDVKLVVHMAAFTNVSEAEKQAGDKEGLAYRLNVQGTQNMVEICTQSKIPLVYISTDYVFDGTSLEPYTEDLKPAPRNWYGYTKYAGEQTIMEHLENYGIIRIGYPYGYAFADKSDWLHSFVNRMKQDKEAPFFNDQWITPLFIDDFVAAMSLYLAQPRTGIWHVYGNQSYTPFELATRLSDIYHIESNVMPQSLQNFIKDNPDKATLYPQSLRMANTKFRSTYSWQPTSFDDAVGLIHNQEL